MAIHTFSRMASQNFGSDPT